MTSTLVQVAAAAQDETFQARVMAAAAMLKLPHHLPYIMQVAAIVNLDNGPEGVTDAEIVAALTPESEDAPVDPEPEEPSPGQVMRFAILDAIAATATPPEDGNPWVQPSGAHDAYSEGSTVTHNDKDWVSLIPFNVWEPGISGWREEVSEEEGYPAWIQPSGGHDAYSIGDRVSFNGLNYESVINSNTWSPTDYPAGWSQID